MVRTDVCVEAAPPPPPKLERRECEYAACYDEENAIALALWSAAIWRWAQDAWQCMDVNSD